MKDRKAVTRVSSLNFCPEKHTYTLGDREIPSVTQILKALGLIDDRHFTEEARLRGQAVHSAIHYWVEDDLDESTLDPKIVPYVDAFREWASLVGLEVFQAEMRVHHLGLGYAGTLDLFGKVQGERSIIEVKTGSMPPWGYLQVAAYALCFDGVLPQRFVLQLKGNGRHKLTPCPRPADLHEWMSCMSVYGLLGKFGRLNGGE